MPGLDGTFEESCIVCLDGTDTGLAFEGEAEWAVAGLVVLGVPVDEAGKTVSMALGMPEGKVPDGVLTMAFRVCAGCAAASAAGVTVGLVATGVPVYRQLTDGEGD